MQCKKLFLVSLSLLSIFGVSSAPIHQVSLFSQPVLAQSVNGFNVKEVRRSNGALFQQQADGSWVEKNPQGQIIFRFQETNRDEWSVYLNDASRNVQLQLDLFRKMITYGTNNGPKRDLYPIASSSSTTSGAIATTPSQPQAPDPLRALGRLQGNGTVEFEPLSAYRDIAFSGPQQTGNMSLTINPKLVLGANGAKYLHVDLDGSLVSASKVANGTLGKDTQYERGWYLENVRTKIIPMDSRLQLYKAADISGGGETGAVTSTTEFGISGSLSGSTDGKAAELGASIGFSQSVGRSYTRNLRGFTASTPDIDRSSGYAVVSNDYKLSGVLYEGNSGLSPYVTTVDIVNKDIPEDSFWGGFASVFTGQAFQGFRVHGLPDRAKKGLPLVSQAIFYANSNFSEPVKVRVEVEATLRRVWVTGDTKVDARWHSQSYGPVTLSKEFVVDFDFDY